MKYLWSHFISGVLRGFFLSLVLLVLGSTILLRLGNFLVVQDTATQSDAIIVLSGGGYERVDKGIELLKAGISDTLIFTGAAFDGTVSNADTMFDYASHQGVDKASIVLEHKATNTLENALFTQKLFTPSPKTITLVTSQYHQKRASIIFRKVYKNTTIYDAPAHAVFWNVESWWSSNEALHLTLSEVLKIVWGRVTGIWG